MEEGEPGRLLSCTLARFHSSKTWTGDPGLAALQQSLDCDRPRWRTTAARDGSRVWRCL